jgi:UDP-glucose 4-epimerase
MNILVTGASGFIGRALCRKLIHTKKIQLVFVTSRSLHPEGYFPYPIKLVPISSLKDLNERHDILSQIDCIVHLAARVHQMQDSSINPLAEFRSVNTEATCNLALAAAKHNVRRFIYLSSIKVNGEQTNPGKPFTPEDIPDPRDPYGLSKAEAEIQLKQISARTGLEVIIIRPPLVYGPGVKANFLSMMKWVNQGIPLPLGAISNRRSLVALPNLVDLIITCLSHPDAANQTFLVSDNEDLSTTELLKRMAKALGKTPRLLPIPASWLVFTASILGKESIARRLCSSLQVDIHKTQTLLNWKPPVTVDYALKLTANHFISGPK